MIRRLLAAALLLAAPAAAQTAPVDLQKAYEQLCAGPSRAGEATCAALKKDLEAAAAAKAPASSAGKAPATKAAVASAQAWRPFRDEARGFSIEWPGDVRTTTSEPGKDGVQRTQLKAETDGSTVYMVLIDRSPIAFNANALPAYVTKQMGDSLRSSRSVTVDGHVGFEAVIENATVRQVNLYVIRGLELYTVVAAERLGGDHAGPDRFIRSFHLDSRSLRNADRGADTREHSLLLGTPAYVDRMFPGETLDGVIEASDGKGTHFGWREDCYGVTAEPGRALKFKVHARGGRMMARVLEKGCGWGGAPIIASETNVDRGLGDFEVRFTQPAGQIAYVWVLGKTPEAHAYQVTVSDMTPGEVADWEADKAASRQAEARRQADREAFVSQLLQGGLMVGEAYVEGQRELADRQAALNQAAAEDRARNEAAARAAEAADAARRTADASARQQAEGQRLADQQRLAEQQRAEQKRLADQKAADARRAAEQQRLAELKRQEEAKKQPVAFKEGVVLCAKKKDRYWRCDGPLQFDYGDIDAPAGRVALKNACGGDLGIHDLGTSGGYRAFGCGFGIHPTARDYPGNRDVPADFGVYVADRGTYYCPTSTLAYCRG